jgi:hypothetical protein
MSLLWLAAIFKLGAWNRKSFSWGSCSAPSQLHPVSDEQLISAVLGTSLFSLWVLNRAHTSNLEQHMSKLILFCNSQMDWPNQLTDEATIERS